MGKQELLFNDYDGFVEKFKPKKTTDDCYTPPEVMEAVNRYVADRWHRDPATFVRPFFPGGDYEQAEYPDGCTVVDNPPFSILSKIEGFYLDEGVSFFLFAPSLSCLGGRRWEDVDHVICDAKVTYANGAIVPTSFVTNLEPGVVLETSPELSKSVTDASDRAAKAGAKELPVYTYPDELLTSARAQYLARHGQRISVRRGECVRVGALDAQRVQGKAIFGSGLLLGERAAAERAAAERAAAERAAAHVWHLSERERAMCALLS